MESKRNDVGKGFRLIDGAILLWYFGIIETMREKEIFRMDLRKSVD